MRRGNRRLAIALTLLVVITLFTTFALLAFEQPVDDTNFVFNSSANVSHVTNTIDSVAAGTTLNASNSWNKGDFNCNGVSADAGDLAMMIDVAVGKYVPDQNYDLNNNGIPADAGDLAMMKDASVGKIKLL